MLLNLPFAYQSELQCQRLVIFVTNLHVVYNSITFVFLSFWTHKIFIWTHRSNASAYNSSSTHKNVWLMLTFQLHRMTFCSFQN